MVSGSEVFLAAGKAWPRGTLVLCEWTLYVCMYTHAHTLFHKRAPHRHGARQRVPYLDISGKRWLVWVALEVAALGPSKPYWPPHLQAP